MFASGGNRTENMSNTFFDSYVATVLQSLNKFTPSKFSNCAEYSSENTYIYMSRLKSLAASTLSMCFQIKLSMFELEN